MNLHEWIAQLEAEEFPKNPLQWKIARRLRTESPGIVAYSTKADLLPACDYVRDVLKVLWADVKFWKLLESAPTPEKICGFAKTTYDLRLPPIEHSVWREMVREDAGRALLFELLRFRSGTFPRAMPSAHALKAIKELREGGRISDLILGYIAGERFDQRYRNAWRDVSTNALRHLEKAACRVATDAKWFLAHPGEKPP